MEKTLRQNALYNILHTVQNVLFPMITAGYLARILQPEGIGAVAQARNLVSYFTMFSLLGLPQYAMREIARERENGDRLYAELLILGAAISGICSLGYWLFVCWQHPGDALYQVLVWEAVLQMISIDWLYQGKGDFRFLTLRSAAEKLLTLWLILLLVREPWHLQRYCGISCLSRGLGCLWSLLRGRRYAVPDWKDLNIVRHLRPVLVLMAGSAAASLYSKVDITMLGILADTQSVAYYVNAHKVITIVVAVSVAVSGVFLPKLSREYGSSRERFSESISLGLEIVLFLAIPCFTGLLLVAEDVTRVLFGPAFAPCGEVIRWLSPLVLIKGAADMVCYQTLLTSGKERKLIPAYLTGGALNLLLNAQLIPLWGSIGAAAASVVSELAVNLLLLAAARKVARPKLDISFLSCVLAGTGGMAIAVALLKQQWGGRGFFLPLTIFVGAAIYLMITSLLLKRRKNHVYANRGTD